MGTGPTDGPNMLVDGVIRQTPWQTKDDMDYDKIYMIITLLLLQLYAATCRKVVSWDSRVLWQLSLLQSDRGLLRWRASLGAYKTMTIPCQDCSSALFQQK